MNKPGSMIAINRIIKTRRSEERRRRTLVNVCCVCNGISLIKVNVRMHEVQDNRIRGKLELLSTSAQTLNDMRRLSQNRYGDVANWGQGLRSTTLTNSQ